MKVLLDSNAYSAMGRDHESVWDLVRWIAAHAMETGADLLSFDDHFEAVDGRWSAPAPAPAPGVLESLQLAVVEGH